MRNTRHSYARVAIGIGVVFITAAMVMGPALSPPVFDWVQHTTSEQAAQGSPGAWAMRIGFTGYGLGALAATLVARTLRLPVRIPFGVFGLGLIGTAIWSNIPIVAGVPADMQEDMLHSVASGVVGTAFALMCVACLLFETPRWRNGPAWAGLTAAIFIPLAMNGSPEIAGLLQRAMFVVSMVVIAGLVWEERAG